MLIAAGLILVLLVSIGIVGLVADPDVTDPSPAPAPGLASTSTAAPVGLPVLETTSDPEVFAGAVAEALFTWDTADGLMPLDYAAVFLASGDPSGVEQAGLAADIASYYPTRDAWQQLRQYATAQTLEIDHAAIPDAWTSAVAEARSGQIVPGTVAVTIDGIRHRTGTVNGRPATVDRPVAFTIFVLCKPAANPCRLLRLSALDSPLR